MRKTIFICAFLSFLLNVQAQEETTTTSTDDTPIEIGRRFNAGFTGGFNASQIDGDNLIGFNKLGWYGGISANAILSEKKYIGIGINYSQRGSSPGLSNRTEQIKLAMLEVPVMFHYCDWKSEEGFYYVHAGMGLSYARLIDISAVSPYKGYESYFQQNNVNWLLETMFYKNKHLGFGIRFSKALNKIYKQPFPDAPNATFRERWLTFRTVYLF